MAPALVDADVHPVMTAAQQDARLAPRWRQHLERYGLRSHSLSAAYPRAVNAGWRLDAKPPGPDGVVGADPDFARRQLLDEYAIDFAILNPSTLLTCQEEEPLAEALAVAVNDWLHEEWLAADPRFLGAITVPIESPAVAVRELERCLGRGGRWVQLIIPAGTEEALGSAKYRPVFEAASAASLPVAVHFGGVDDHAGPGAPSYYIEEHVAYAVRVQARVANLICSGIFAELPHLRFVLTEFGFAWVAALGFALDRAWERFPDDVPRLDRRPSELLHEHFWLTTQPVDEPADPAQLELVIREGRLGDRLLFSTDYPHWDFDSPKQALPRALPDALRRRIFAGNASALHALDRFSSAPEATCS